MIVFRETGLVDVSGNILTDSQFLSSVKVNQILHPCHTPSPSQYFKMCAEREYT